MIPSDTTIDAIPLAVIDVETTGLSATGGDRICEIAVLRADPDGTETLVHSLVNPERLVSPGAAAVNGLSDAELAQAPLFADIADAVVDALRGAAFVAHNVPFDRGFLDSELRRIDAPPAVGPAVDTLALARTHFRFPSNKLGMVARMLRVPVERAHRADSDVRTTLGVLRGMRPHLESQGVRTLADYVRASVGAQSQRGRFSPEAPPAIQAALISGDQVEINYRTASRMASRRIVRPLRLQGNYLIAFCELRRDERTFRLDRIEGARLLRGSGDVGRISGSDRGTSPPEA